YRKIKVILQELDLFFQVRRSIEGWVEQATQHGEKLKSCQGRSAKPTTCGHCEGPQPSGSAKETESVSSPKGARGKPHQKTTKSQAQDDRDFSAIGVEEDGHTKENVKGLKI
ncbi:hypothetical protein NFI96_021936, partial [Prochilodus magdalenae]